MKKSRLLIQVSLLVIFSSLLVQGCQQETITPQETIQETATPQETIQETRTSEAELVDALFTVETVSCPQPLPFEGEVEGQTYDCGVVTVPENYDNPSGRQIELTFLRLRSPNPAPDPVIYLSGGPGGSATGEMQVETLYNNANKIRAHRDFIAFDQRGTGYSGIIACSPFLAAIGVIEELDPELAVEIENASEAGGNQIIFNAACATGYQSVGVDLSHYTTIDSTQDIASITNALGYDQGYNLYGTSYGTRLALQALRETPQNIRSAVIDGLSPPDITGMAWTAAKRWEVYKSIFDQCAANEACNAAYPNLEQQFIDLLTELQTNPIVLDPPFEPLPFLAADLGFPISQIDGQFFVGLAKIINDAPRGGPAFMVPRLIQTLNEGNTDYLRSSKLANNTPPVDQPLQPAELPPTIEDIFGPTNPLFVPALTVLLSNAQAEASETASLPDQWVKLIVDDLVARLGAGEDQVEVIKDLVEFSLLPVQKIDAETLQTFAAEKLSPEVAANANNLVAEMSKQDVRSTMWRITDISTRLQGTNERHLANGTMLAVHCAEELAYSDRQDVEDYLADLPYPGLILFTADDFDLNYKIPCQFYPPTRFDESVTAPVQSDIPTLIFQEALDTQTPLSFAQPVRDNLSNNYYVEWPNEGHVILARSKDNCAGQIAAEFLDTPTQEPDTSCSQSELYQINFEIPN